MRIALPYLCGRSTTSDIPAIFGLGRLVDRCVSWRHRQALTAVRPSMFADITVRAVERLWLATAGIVWLW